MTFKEYTDTLVKLSEEYTRGVEQFKKALDELIKQHTLAEPLIKDEKIRKAVRAWAELNESEELHQFNNYQLEDNNNYLIEFADGCFTNLEVGKNYTIAELCGEEEE